MTLNLDLFALEKTKRLFVNYHVLIVMLEKIRNF